MEVLVVGFIILCLYLISKYVINYKISEGCFVELFLLVLVIFIMNEVCQRKPLVLNDDYVDEQIMLENKYLIRDTAFKMELEPYKHSHKKLNKEVINYLDSNEVITDILYTKYFDTNDYFVVVSEYKTNKRIITVRANIKNNKILKMETI